MDCDTDMSVGGGGGTPSGSGFPGASGSSSDGGLSGGTAECFYPSGSPPGTTPPAATVEYVIETFTGPQLLHMRLTFNPAFVDNSYGATSIGWGSHGHKYSELVGSDHAELAFLDKVGTTVLAFKLDYISISAAAPSGYACLGVNGGEGRMTLGNASAIDHAITSLDRNLNERGYKTFIVDSPKTDASYTPPAGAPNWDFRVVYEVWVRIDALGPSGFGDVKLTYVHASPSKLGVNTQSVVKGPCPPGWGNPPG
jgi:hypothetical protein